MCPDDMNPLATAHWTLDDVDVALYLGCGKARRAAAHFGKRRRPTRARTRTNTHYPCGMTQEPSDQIDYLEIKEQQEVCAAEHRRRGCPLQGKTLQDIRAFRLELFGGAGFPTASLHDAGNGRQCAAKPETAQIAGA